MAPLKAGFHGWAGTCGFLASRVKVVMLAREGTRPGDQTRRTRNREEGQASVQGVQGLIEEDKM